MAEIKKDMIYEIEIIDMGSEGEGIGKIEGYPLFVKDAIIGDKIEAKVIKALKNYGYGRLLRIIEKSDFRMEAPCPYARPCGGCQIQAMNYQAQLNYKKNKVMNHLTRIGGFSKEFIQEILEETMGMKEPFRYRNKAQFPISQDKDGNLVAGFYAGRTHSIIPIEDCLIGIKENKVILDRILDFMNNEKISAYDETTGKGLVRHVLIRKGFYTEEIMVCIVINGTKLPAEEDLIKELKKIKGMTSISLNTNTERTNVILGKKIRSLWGRDTIRDEIRGISFEISPLSFYQVNPIQTETLYGKALEFAGLTGKETVWDLYCGIGTISLFLAQRAKKVYGVEIVEQAIRDARENANRNHIENVEFFTGKAEEVLPKKYEEEGIYADVIVVDPPRKGCDEACLETMLKMRPERIVYVSCDSATLSRDLKILVEGGYELLKAVPVDMFPHTVHVESVSQLKLKK